MGLRRILVSADAAFEVRRPAWSAAFRLAGLLGAAVPAAAQPPPLSPPDLARGLAPLAEVEALAVPGIAAGLLRSAVATAPGAPLEFALPHAVEVDPAGAGAWETPPGGATRVWRLRIAAPGALSLNLGFTRYRMPPGGRLHLYTPDYGTFRGPFTEEDNEDHGQLWTPILPGDEVVVQVSVPAGRREELDLELGSVNRGFRNIAEPAHAGCHVNVACPRADPYRDQVRSVALITIEGKGYCSGALLNNAALDRTPYLLTAAHCVGTEAEANSTVAYWNFESPACLQEHGGSKDDSQSGAYLRAASRDTDFSLLELDDDPGKFNTYLAGWDRSEKSPQATVGIHHPRSSEKSIAIENDPLEVGPGSVPDPPSFLDSDFWVVRDWDVGMSEDGSSGSPLFNPGKRVIGQLKASEGWCGHHLNASAYGRFDRSWTGSGSGSRLSDWLDPGDADAGHLDGMESNRPPVSKGLWDRTVRLDEGSHAWDLADRFPDPEGDPLTFTATSSAPAVATVSVSGSTATFTLAAAGTTAVTVTATDAGGSKEAATAAFDLTVSAASNLAPEVADALPGLRLPIGDGAVTLSVAGAFRDPDGDVLTYGASSANEGVVSVTAAGANLTLTPLAAGTATIAATATDAGGTGTAATAEFDVVVPSRPPEAVGTLADVVLLKERGAVTVSLAGAFTDPDGDALTYGASSSSHGGGSPGGSPPVVRPTVSGSVATLHPGRLGTATVTVTATDVGGSDTAASLRFDVTVKVTASFEAAAYVATEGSEWAHVRVILGDSPGTSLTIPLEVTAADAAATDYTAPPAIEFEPWWREWAVNVFAVADDVAEPDETLTIALGTLPEIATYDHGYVTGPWIVVGNHGETTVTLRNVGGGGPGPGGGGGGGGGGPPPAGEDDGDGSGPPGGGGGGGGPVDAEIAADAACADGLCRVRAGVAVEFRDKAGGIGSSLWDFGDGTLSRSATVTHSWAEPGFYTVTLEKSGGGVRSIAAVTFLVEAAYPAGTCAPGAETLCLQDSRYAVRAEWRTASGESGAGLVVRSGTNDAGLFRFFDPDNWEVLIKVLDGCAVNGNVWVYGASTTDLGYAITVTDTATGVVKEYRNEPGEPATAIADPVAFPESCPEPAASRATHAAPGPPRRPSAPPN